MKKCEFLLKRPKRARAEKSTFRKELSFQRSESTTGLPKRIAFLCAYFSNYFVWKYKQILTSLNDWTYLFSIKNIRRHIWKPWSRTFSLAVISKCLRIRAQCCYKFVWCRTLIFKSGMVSLGSNLDREQMSKNIFTKGIFFQILRSKNWEKSRSEMDIFFLEVGLSRIYTSRILCWI